MDHLPELDQPRPEDRYFLHEEERLSLQLMLALDEERQQTDAPLTWQQEFEFLMSFIASPPEELRLALRNHVKVMIVHVIGYLMQQYPDESTDYSEYEKLRERICGVVLEDLEATGICSQDDLEHSDLWKDAFVDLLRHVGEPRGNDLL